MENISTLPRTGNGKAPPIKSLDFPIPMPENSLPPAAAPRLQMVEKTNTKARERMPQNAPPTILQQYGSLILGVIGIVGSAIPAIAVFAVMQYRLGALEELHRRDMEAVNARITNENLSVKQGIADAQAYGNSALSQTKFVQGILMGKGILNPGDIQQVQNQK